MKIVTFGEIMVRLSAPDNLRLVQSNQYKVSFAGAEANVAVSLANYGVDVDYVTCLPNNPIAERCIMELRGHKVGVDNICRCGKRIGILYLEKGNNSRPSIVYYDREDSSIATINEGTFDWYAILKGVDWFHWTGITPAISENAAKECYKAIKVASKLGMIISCDLNFRESLWNYGKQACDVMPQMVSYSDVILANEEDCEKIFGIKPKDFNVNSYSEGIEQRRFLSVCKQMMEKFPRCKKMAISIRGSINADYNTWGGIIYNGKTLCESRRYDITDIVDRVGGGDSFMGGLIYGLTHYDNEQDALDFATAASCLKHTIQGDYNCVSVQEVEKLMRGNINGRVQR